MTPERIAELRERSLFLSENCLLPKVGGELYECLDEIERLQTGLAESLKLQSHYATLLNIQDGGKRMKFKTVDDWLKRLDECKSESPP